MFYFTQLIYLKPGAERVFEEFEAVALPLLEKYNGQLLLRVRTTENSKVAGTMEVPYEIHVGTFGTEEDFDRFLQDETRSQFIHLKDQSIRSVLLLKGLKAG